MWEKYKSWSALVVAVVVCVFGVATIKKYISNQISINTQALQENFEKQKYEIKVKYDTEKSELEQKLKQDIINIQKDLETCKLEAETKAKKQEYRELSKNNPGKFKKEVDKVLGVKGKTR